jgi:hypothetical protein
MHATGKVATPPNQFGSPALIGEDMQVVKPILRNGDISL